jgi:hypothetical protein
MDTPLNQPIVLTHRGGTVRVATEADQPPPVPPRRVVRRFDHRRLRVARANDNELVLFDHERRESWIVYPPRSAYDHLRRPAADAVIVEHRSWEPFNDPESHIVRPADGCLDHGLDCGAQSAIQAGIESRWNPFG